jgi:ATP-dependent DNA helicase RecG
MNVNRYLPHYADGAVPQFVENDMFTTVVPLSKGTQKTKAGSQKSSQKILEILREQPKTTIQELASSLAISDRAIKKHISNLKDQGRLRRIGPDKGGHWEVVDREDGGGSQ